MKIVLINNSSLIPPPPSHIVFMFIRLTPLPDIQRPSDIERAILIECPLLSVKIDWRCTTLHLSRARANVFSNKRHIAQPVH